MVDHPTNASQPSRMTGSNATMKKVKMAIPCLGYLGLLGLLATSTWSLLFTLWGLPTFFALLLVGCSLLPHTFILKWLYDTVKQGRTADIFFFVSCHRCIVAMCCYHLARFSCEPSGHFLFITHGIFTAQFSTDHRLTGASLIHF